MLQRLLIGDDPDDIYRLRSQYVRTQEHLYIGVHPQEEEMKQVLDLPGQLLVFTHNPSKEGVQRAVCSAGRVEDFRFIIAQYRDAAPDVLFFPWTRAFRAIASYQPSNITLFGGREFFEPTRYAGLDERLTHAGYSFSHHNHK